LVHANTLSIASLQTSQGDRRFTFTDQESLASGRRISTGFSEIGYLYTVIENANAVLDFSPWKVPHASVLERAFAINEFKQGKQVFPECKEENVLHGITSPVCLETGIRRSFGNAALILAAAAASDAVGVTPSANVVTV
jgi:hypothetical protein